MEGREHEKGVIAMWQECLFTGPSPPVTRWRGQVWVGEREERMRPSYSHSQIQEGDNGAMEDVFRK